MNKYQDIADQVLKEVEEHIGRQVIIEKWKSKSTKSGKAFYNEYRIVVPEPTDADTLNTFCHELGHLISYVKPSCLNEYNACIFALQKLREHGIPISRNMKRHHKWYIAYSLGQALNRGMKNIPEELKPFKKYLTKVKVHWFDGKGKQWTTDAYRADMSKC